VETRIGNVTAYAFVIGVSLRGRRIVASLFAFSFLSCLFICAQQVKHAYKSSPLVENETLRHRGTYPGGDGNLFAQSCQSQAGPALRGLAGHSPEILPMA
jgi:hypothetical protein